MLNDKKYKNWLKSTKEIIEEYNLKELNVQVKEMHPFNKKANKIMEKDMVHIKIKDVHEIIVDNTTYDILEQEINVKDKR